MLALDVLSLHIIVQRSVLKQMVIFRKIEIYMDNITVRNFSFHIIFKSFKQLGFPTTTHTGDNFDIRRSDHIDQFI